MQMELSESAQKVQDALQKLGLSLEVVELPGSTRTALEAAQATGCQVGQIVKSLIFRTRSTGRAILVLVSGANRVNEKRLAQVVGEPIEKADAEFVRQQTGFAIGGVPPVGHSQLLETYIDQDLMNFAEIWAAAGTPHAVFRLTPENLIRMAGDRVIQIT
jgi:prolyl-tRNA editing enzyme YbaK/EbsC (Cys-tRNA(Pro) deacylase)